MDEPHDIPADRNKTDLTHDVTEAASRWLSGIGAKCLETEVGIGPKWIADVAGFWRPTPTEAVEQKLIPRRKPYPYGQSVDAVDAWKSVDAERVARFHALPEIITIAVEVKTTRNDFNKDVGRKFVAAPFTDLRVLAVPAGLLKPWKDPPGWWIITVSGKEVVHVARSAPILSTPLDIKLRVVAAIGERNHNRHHYAFWSALNKRQRADARRQP
jgi:hypothetical protein